MEVEKEKEFKRGEKVMYNKHRHYVVYCSDDFVLLSKKKSLEKAFCVRLNELKNEQKK